MNQHSAFDLMEEQCRPSDCDSRALRFPLEMESAGWQAIPVQCRGAEATSRYPRGYTLGVGGGQEIDSKCTPDGR